MAKYHRQALGQRNTGLEFVKKAGNFQPVQICLVNM
jgi:hypothetical protein